jgi:hypothetical protein
MKTILTLIFVSACLLFCNSCQEDVLPMDEAVKNPVVIDFYANFTSSSKYSEEYENPLKSGKWIDNTQSGEGIATYLGKFTFSMSCLFCCNGEDCGKYDSGRACFTSETGDKLYICFSGKASIFDPSDPSGYAGKIEDNFSVSGGTGLFANATGVGTLKSCFTCQLAKIDHVMIAKINTYPE